MKSFVLLMACRDQPGIVARITGELYRTGCNVLALEQHVEDDGHFFMRIEADITRMSGLLDELSGRLEEIAAALDGRLTLHDPARRQRVAVLVSTEAACLQELVMKQQTGDLNCELVVVISNREDLRATSESYGLPFHFVPDTDRTEHEAGVLRRLDEAQVDLVVLARYMRILSAEFVAHYAGRIINIHHGFLPAFKGAGAYRQAWERGVKIIGATAHFVTAGLDEGPIIAQDVTRVTHHYSAAAMARTGRDIEKRVLADAVAAYLEYRLIQHAGRTIVFRA
jgi:formyltetrahydrofolate deformylase